MSEAQARTLGDAADELQDLSPLERLALVAGFRALLKAARDGCLQAGTLDPERKFNSVSLARAFDLAASSGIGVNAWAYVLDTQLESLIERVPPDAVEKIRRIAAEDEQSRIERWVRNSPAGVATLGAAVAGIAGTLLPRALASLAPGMISGPIGTAIGVYGALLMLASLRAATSQDRALVQPEILGLAHLIEALTAKDAVLGIGDISIASIVLHIAQQRAITVEMDDRLAARACAWMNDAAGMQATVRDPDQEQAATGFGFVFIDSVRGNARKRQPELHFAAGRPSRYAVLTTGRFLARTVGAERDVKAGFLEDGSLRAVVALPTGQDEREAGTGPLAREGGAYLVYFDTRMRDPASPILMAAAPAQTQRSILGMKAAGLLGGALDTVFSSQARPDLYALANAMMHPAPHDLQKVSLDLPFAFVERENLRKGRYNLLPERYLPGMATSTVDGVLSRLADSGRRVDLTLIDVADILKPQALQDISDDETDPSPLTVLDAVPDDIDERFAALRTPSKRVTIRQRGGKAKDRAKAQMLQEGDVLVTIRGRCGRVALVADSLRTDASGVDGWTPGQSFARLRLRAGGAITDPAVLAAYLRSPLGQAQLAGITTRGSADQISLPDLRGIRIVVPTDAEVAELQCSQARVQQLHGQIVQLEAEVDRLADDAWPSSLIRAAERAALLNEETEE